MCVAVSVILGGLVVVLILITTLYTFLSDAGAGSCRSCYEGGVDETTHHLIVSLLDAPLFIEIDRVQDYCLEAGKRKEIAPQAGVRGGAKVHTNALLLSPLLRQIQVNSPCQAPERPPKMGRFRPNADADSWVSHRLGIGNFDHMNHT